MGWYDSLVFLCVCGGGGGVITSCNAFDSTIFCVCVKRCFLKCPHCPLLSIWICTLLIFCDKFLSFVLYRQPLVQILNVCMVYIYVIVWDSSLFPLMLEDLKVAWMEAHQLNVRVLEAAEKVFCVSKGLSSRSAWSKAIWSKPLISIEYVSARVQRQFLKCVLEWIRNWDHFVAVALWLFSK